MKIKRLIAGALTAVSIFSVVGCSAVTGGKVEGSNLTLWYEPSTVKIIQNDEGEAVKTASKKKVLQVSMAQNESEGVQMMMYAKQDVESYNVTVSDLESDNSIIPSEAVDIYLVKYQTATRQGHPEFSEGEIPDPLLPFEKAVEYKENNIDKGNNQSIYLDVETETSTSAGVYSGVVKVTTSEETYTMPLTVTVHDIALPDTPELETAFSWFDRDHFTSAELDGTDEMMTTYFEYLHEFNMSGVLPFEGVGGADAFCELVRKYYDYPGFTAYRLYYETNGSQYNGTQVGYDAHLLKQYIERIAEISVEDRVNYLDKAYAYMYTVIDEPSTHEQFVRAKQVLDVYNQVLRDVDAACREKYVGTEKYDYYDSVVSETLLDVPYIIPGSYKQEYIETYGLQNLTFVPQINGIHTEENRAMYKEGREDKKLWTYSCVYPSYPYPSGHTDDYTLGFRLTSWMCHEYDLDGYLMWATVDYLRYEYGEVISDPWENMMAGSSAPGDGRLFYPGAKYGIEGPCPSLRAMAYRDGVDDYSILEAFTDVYEQYGMNADVALQQVYRTVYSGVIPITDSYVFENTRELLFAMYEELQNDTGVLYNQIEANFDKAIISFKTVNAEAVVKVDGKEMKSDKNGYYTFDVDLTKQNTFGFTVTCGKESKEYTQTLLDGTLKKVSGFEDITDIASYVFSSTAGYKAEVNENDSFVQEGNKSLHLVLNPEKTNTVPYFAIEKTSKLIGGSWDGVEKLMFYVYNAGTEACKMNTSYYTTTEAMISEYELEPQKWTLVEIQMPATVQDVNSINEFDFNFEEGSSVELYMDNFALIMEEE